MFDQGDMSVLCACGRRRGMHRHGDEACPNPEWLREPGNGKPQWLAGWTFTRSIFQPKEQQEAVAP
jgi:hypothetical protein